MNLVDIEIRAAELRSGDAKMNRWTWAGWKHHKRGGSASGLNEAEAAGWLYRHICMHNAYDDVPCGFCGRPRIGPDDPRDPYFRFRCTCEFRVSPRKSPCQSLVVRKRRRSRLQFRE